MCVAMKFRKQLAVLFAAVMLLTGCGSEQMSSGTGTADTAESSEAAPTEKNMVVLGDSISFGYGLEDIEAERYSTLLKAMMEERDGLTWNDYNYALSGDDSSDLLERLERGRAMRLPSADLIVLYIGANNLLGVYSDYIAGIADEYDIDYENITEEELASLQADIEARMQDTEQVMQELTEAVDANLERLEQDMESIYTWIRERNPNAEIYVLNIYNPYSENADIGLPTGDEPFSSFSQTQIDRANAILEVFVSSHDDLIPVDIASAYASYDHIPVQGYLTLSESEEMSYYDPHPDAEGQRLIADTVFAVMKEHA